MASYIFNNIEDFRLNDQLPGEKEAVEIEDVMKVGLPSPKRQTTSIDVAGMAGAIEVPANRLEAMDFTITHNNGINCERLSMPGKHSFWFRTAVQQYDKTDGTMKHFGDKWHLEGLWVETQNGDIETGSPNSTTEKYSCTLMERYRNGVRVLQIDLISQVVIMNGQNQFSSIKDLLV